MSSTLIVTLVTIVVVGWLGYVAVNAFRSRGQEVAPNITPGVSDDVLETKRLERAQQVAVVFAAFAAIFLPLYFLGETSRQQAFAQTFQQDSITRGEHLVQEFGCFGCHGPNGVGGVAAFVDPRSGVAVRWAAPSINDVFLRYSKDEVTFWVTYGRGNTPMPPWGTAGGGPLNEQQVSDIVNYIESIQIPQADALKTIQPRIDEALKALDGADQAMADLVLTQRQNIAAIDNAPSQFPAVDKIAKEAADVFARVGQGIDTDGDGVSDVAEETISKLSAEINQVFLDGLTTVSFGTDAKVNVDVAKALVADLETLAKTNPGVVPAAEAARKALDTGVGPDGLTADAETTMKAQLAAAITVLTPPGLPKPVTLDPKNPASVGGVPDLETARKVVGEIESIHTNLGVSVDNAPKLRANAQKGLDFLLQAQKDRKWQVDFQGVANQSFGGDLAKAKKAVGLFDANCARCHTASWSAGVPLSQQPGSGGFGPALWDKRPVVQFGPKPTDPAQEDLLMTFLLNGSQAEKPYGLNGFGSGRMPAFGKILSKADLELIATYIRGGKLNGIDR